MNIEDNRMKWKWMLLVIAIIGTIYGLTVTDNQSVQHKKNNQVLSFAIFGDAQTKRIIEKTVEIFGRQNNCEVEVYCFSSQEELDENVIWQMISGKSFDVFYVDKPTLELINKEKWLLELDDIVERRAAEGDFFYDKALTYGKLDNKQLALPIGEIPYVIYYNIDMFNSYQIKTPQYLFDNNEWNYRSFLEIIGKFSKSTGEPAFLLDSNRTTIEMYLRMISSSFEMSETDMVSFLDLNFQDTVDLVRNGNIQYESFNENYDISNKIFISGQIPMIIGDLSATKAFHNTAFKWDIIPFPSSTTNYNTSIYETPMVAGYDGQNSEIALKFIDFYVSHIGQKLRIENGDSLIPSLDMTFYSSMGDVTFPDHSNYYFYVIEHGNIYSKEVVEQADMQALTKKWDTLLTRVGEE